MADEITPEDISNTQQILGKYVNRPPLTEKLLKKPPFRFLHDVINAVIRETGFLKGLYTEAELLSDNVKDRDSKVAFLNKLITAVKTITGTDLKVRASKIIAGLEPAETNKLLQAIGKAVDDKTDSKEYVNQLKGGKTKEKSKVKESEKVKKSTSKSSVKSDKSSDSTRVKKSVETPKATTKTKLATVKETPKKSTGSKTKSSSKESISKVDSKKHAKSKDSPRGKESPKVVKKSESPRVDKKESPRAASKDKKESPRAVVNNKESPRENSEVVKEKIDSPRLLEQEEGIIKKDADIVEENVEIQENAKVDEEVGNEEGKTVENNQSEEVKADRPKTAARFKSGNRMNPLVANVPVDLPLEAQKLPEKRIQEQPISRPKSSLRPPSVRPSSARPGAPRLRPDSALPLKEMIPLGKINVIVENFGDVENKEEDEEETVVIQNVIEDIQEPISLEKTLGMPADKGHLVEQILEQIQGPEQLEEVKEKNNWENENIRGKDATTKEINQLRASIQSLTRTANPLGKLMSYLHEDVEAMHSELDSWTNLKNQYTSEINVQRRANSESNQPLINQLQEIEDNIKKQREEIANVKFNILKNEEKIRDLISKQVVV